MFRSLNLIGFTTRTLSTSHARLSIATLPFGNSTLASSFPPPGIVSSILTVCNDPDYIGRDAFEKARHSQLYSW